MVIRLLTISLMLLSLQGVAQFENDSIIYDSVYISQVRVIGFSFGTNMKTVKEVLGKPSSFYTLYNEIDDSGFFSVCNFFGDSVSLSFGNDDEFDYVGYVMAIGSEIELDKKKFKIGESISRLKKYFPNSYNSYLLLKDKGKDFLFLKGISDAGPSIGFDFYIMIRDDKIHSFGTTRED